jgi:transposase
MRVGVQWLTLCAVAPVAAISGCSRGHANNWQQTYEGCKTLASAMAQDKSGLLKPPDCERIQQFCSNDANSIDCKSELANYSTK